MVHLVGSVPLADTEQVMRTASAALGERLRRIPDGETGERKDWISWLEPLFRDHPDFEPSGEMFQLHESSPPRVRYRIKNGVDVSRVGLGELGYARHAQESYAVFKRLKAEGAIHRDARFQVDVVPAHSVLWLFVVDENHAIVDPIYNQAMGREIEEIAASIPCDELAIQVDVASAAFARLQRLEGSIYGRTRPEMIDTFAGILNRLAAHVPSDVELMFHFCYGDSGHRHVVEPTDMGDMVDFANALTTAIRRPISLIHMPVPRDRDDDGYFAPLNELRLHVETELCLGLVHLTDGLAGTRRRMATARRFVDDFSIATECGFGRRPAETIHALLRLHADAAAGG